MHDLQPVAFRQIGVGPAIARHDVAIQFHGHAIGFHPEDFHQRRERKRDGSTTKVPLFSIDLKCHGMNFHSVPGRLGTRKEDCSALAGR